MSDIYRFKDDGSLVAKGLKEDLRPRFLKVLKRRRQCNGCRRWQFLPLYQFRCDRCHKSIDGIYRGLHEYHNVLER